MSRQDISASQNISASQHFLRVESPNADSASQLPFEPACARAGALSHPSHCLSLKRLVQFKARGLLKALRQTKNILVNL